MHETITLQPDTSDDNFLGNVGKDGETSFKSQALESLENRLDDFKQSVTELDRYLVTYEKLKELKGEICKEETEHTVCNQRRTFQITSKGTVIVISWKCPSGHFGKWESSEVLCTRRNNNIYVTDLLVSSCILLSGNNYAKISLFAKMLNMHIPSQSSFSTTQKLYCAPAIKEYWEEMRVGILNEMKKYEDLGFSGDGRNDSPGHDAK